MAITLQTSLASVLSNKRRVSALKALGVLTVGDALTYYPFRVTDPLPICTVSQLVPGQTSAFVATVQSVAVVPMNMRRGYRLEVRVSDASSATLVSLIYFSKRKSYVDWVVRKFRVGATIVVGGTVGAFNGQLQLTHPQIVTVLSAETSSAETSSSHASATDITDVTSIEEGLARLSAPHPVYHASSRISSEHIHETIVQILHALCAEDVQDIVPESVRQTHGYMHRIEAFAAIHNPTSVETFHKAIDTLRFEEALVSQVAVCSARYSVTRNSAKPCTDDTLRQRFVQSLPFELTQGQRAVIDEIIQDMNNSHPMRRLLQGEVGSGKTVVALAAMLQAVASGSQAVLVAPTQVLAYQHAQTIRAQIEVSGLDVPVLLVTGGMKLADRRRALASVASGTPQIIVATHAAFSASFMPTNLSLVVIDEQHRFGVAQRNVLMRNVADANDPNVLPHLLVMTATPIPRSAAMTWFGDLDVSYLMQLPSGRKPIATFIVQETDAHRMASMFAHIRARLDAGERAYVVCPHIDDAVQDDDGALQDDDFMEVNVDDAAEEMQQSQEATAKRSLHAVTSITKRLQALPQFAGIGFATLTGKDSDETKAATMKRFLDGDVKVLVATTVIEVGVDVPEASCIVIFDADRFGLAQLHQLRGRVGRAGTRAWAFLVAGQGLSELAHKRLQVVASSLDGAMIAQQDLQLRNVGDVLGDSQSGGHSSLKLLRVVQDAAIISAARADALELLNSDHALEHYPLLAGAVLDCTRGNVMNIMSN